MRADSENGHRPQSADRPDKMSTKNITLSPNSSPSFQKPTFDIRDHEEKLKPAKERGKYYCPVCDDDNFTINKKTGAFTCWGSECKPKAIMDVLAPLEPRHLQPYRRQRPKQKSRREKDKTVVENSVHIESQVDHLCLMVSEGYESLETAQVALSNFCKEEGYSEFHATNLLKARVKERIPAKTPDDVHRLVKEYRLIQANLGRRLRFNTLFQQVELDGERFNPSAARLEMMVTHGMSLKSGREDIADITIKLAKENSYSPIVEYLDQVSERYGKDVSTIESLAQRYFGTQNPVYDLMVRRFLIAAVARTYQPGCKHDCALILQGPQEHRKSTWLKALASEPWFDDSMGAASEKDEKMKLHRRWIIEWAELETVFKRKDVSQTKAFLSSSTDLVRPPYARDLEDMHRPSVIAGTTNEKEFLSDSTGSSRFWVIPVRKLVDAKTVSDERDLIWAAAVAAYRSGERWWWETAEDGDINALNAPYQTHDPWEEIIADRVEGMREFTTQWVLGQVLQMDPERQLMKHAKKIGSILRSLGFEQTGLRVQPDGKKRRLWVPEYEITGTMNNTKSS